MYNITGLPGWIRFGYSPGWRDRSPTGLPPTAQWLVQSGNLQKYLQDMQKKNIPPATAQSPIPQFPIYTNEQEKSMLEQQVQMMESQIQAVRKRLQELDKKEKEKTNV
jgi:hypothetical protein